MEPVNYTTQSLEQSNIGVCSRTGLDGMRVSYKGRVVPQAVQGQGDALLRDLVAAKAADRPHTFGGKLDLAKLRLPGVPELLFVTPGEDSVRPGPVLLTPWANLPSAVKGAKAVCGSLKQRLALLV